MQLLEITLENFRQFQGKQSISFAGQGDQNVTLVYGPNGGGKTTLLNAFIWALYGTFTDDFEQPERLIHGDTWAKAEAGTRLPAMVELQFEHAGRRYRLVRRASVTKESSDQKLRDRELK